MEEKVDIVALGELLIDFTEAGHSQDGRKLFEQNPGGAPANQSGILPMPRYQLFLPFFSSSTILL